MRNYCNYLTIKNINEEVNLFGWVNNIRIFKNIIFIKFRDISGFIQILCKKNITHLWNDILLLNNESCIEIFGILKNKKDNFDTLEVLAYYINILNYSISLPLDINNINNSENIRFKYRYLDLRRNDMLNIIKLRSNIKFFINSYFIKNNFIEVETPFLSKSFSEGANSYKVISRIYKNKFYSLPQSPQIFKQLLMISGIDRYYQIVKCFRDEDLRSNRQPEFTQIDVEMSFVNFDILYNLINKLICNIWLNFKNYRLNNFFKKISYLDSINIYGTEKPDLRNPIKYNFNFSLFLFKNLFKKFNLNNIKTIIVKNVFNILNINLIFNFLNNKNIYNYLCIYIYDKKNNIYKYKIFGNFNVDNDFIQKIICYLNIKINTFISIILLNKNFDFSFLINLRNYYCNFFNLFKKNDFYPIWVTNFPMFSYDIANNISAYHHPFTMPLNITLSNLKCMDNYSLLFANSYDLIINGYELGSGSKRIHNYEFQKEIFNILGIKKKYNFFLNSLKYGAPPHLGIALGLDRIIMLLTDIKNIKDVIAFPKTNSGLCLLTGSPD